MSATGTVLATGGMTGEPGTALFVPENAAGLSCGGAGTGRSVNGGVDRPVDRPRPAAPPNECPVSSSVPASIRPLTGEPVRAFSAAAQATVQVASAPSAYRPGTPKMTRV